ncbi:unnamed protein product [Sphagnum jensenii]|uniref:Photosystem I subunit VIII n=1 Tax=Sphagnum jensenii TaxID=128206 RepID=A0ABP1BY65_9BRYO
MASCCTKNCISSSAFVSAQILIVWSSVKSDIDCTKRSFCVKLSQILIPISFSAFLHHGSFCKLGDCLVI